MTGKLIVIDGIDGAGKATQTRLLVEALTTRGIAVEKMDFPSYGKPVYGEFLAECLAGKHGDFLHLDPKIASTLFSLNRFEATPQIKEWLAEGKVVILDRFSSSNQIHQGGKIVDGEKRKAFFAWAEKVEHDVLGVPRPDATIYLRIPVSMSEKLLSNEREVKNALLAEGAKDVLEKDRMYLERSFESAEVLSKSPNWYTVECVQGGEMRSREEVHAEIIEIVENILA